MFNCWTGNTCITLFGTVYYPKAGYFKNWAYSLNNNNKALVYHVVYIINSFIYIFRLPLCSSSNFLYQTVRNKKLTLENHISFVI
jgi:hypothetical protein